MGRLGLAMAAAISAMALLAATAQAATITVGSVLPTPFAPTPFGKVQTQLNTALPEAGANLVSPVNGAIVRWRAEGLKGGPFYLRVLHPNGKGAYEAVGTSQAATPIGEGVQTFATTVPIRAGDLIGIDPTSASDEIGVAAVAGASFATIYPPPLEGATVPPNGSEAGKELLLSAEVQPAPAITAIEPSHGPVTGGTSVTITGTNLNAASAVKFGETAAASFVVESDTKIKATAPVAARAGEVDLTVTTLAGTSPAAKAGRFTYTACTVPKLKGKTLNAARNTLRRAGCKLGNVKGERGKGAKVTKQNPKPHKVLAPGGKVNVTLVLK